MTCYCRVCRICPQRSEFLSGSLAFGCCPTLLSFGHLFTWCQFMPSQPLLYRLSEDSLLRGTTSIVKRCAILHMLSKAHFRCAPGRPRAADGLPLLRSHSRTPAGLQEPFLHGCLRSHMVHVQQDRGYTTESRRDASARWLQALTQELLTAVLEHTRP
jgi:hypothetical protein